jgi:hypothetical protein
MSYSSGQQARRAREREERSIALPYKRVGICCGAICRRLKRIVDVPLYRVGDQCRYRCRGCFRIEAGYYP